MLINFAEVFHCVLCVLHMFLEILHFVTLSFHIGGFSSCGVAICLTVQILSQSVLCKITTHFHRSKKYFFVPLMFTCNCFHVLMVNSH